jgi:PAS domain S-box-containing protein
MRGLKPPAEDAELRRRAEERLKNGEGRATARLSQADVRKLVYELEVHQIQLEMQNEELRTCRLDTEAALARSTELFDFAPIGYATLAPPDLIEQINHSGAQFFGKERAALVGRGFAFFVVPEYKMAFDEVLSRAHRTDGRQSCEIEIRCNGARPVQLRVSAIKLFREAPTLLLAFEDISVRKAREAELAGLNVVLREASMRKDEFMAVLSHELRNPLAPIRNSVFVLGRAPPGSDKSRRALAIIERQVAHLTRLVDDLLDVTRITSGKVRLKRSRVELGDLARRTMDDYRNSFDSSGIRLEGVFEPGLFWVDADPARLTQCVSNLLGNAEKFTPRGGKVALSLQREGGNVVLRVRDSGAGIAPEVLKHLFEPFTQAPQTMDRARGGLGLGLAMV